MASERNERSSDRAKSKPGTSVTSSDGLAHGVTIAGSIVLFLWLGDLLDARLGTSPLFALSGMMLGAAASFYRMYVHLVILPREREMARMRDRKDGST